MMNGSTIMSYWTNYGNCLSETMNCVTNSNGCWKPNCCLNYETNYYANLNCDWSLNENSIPMNCYCYATSLNGNLSCGSMNCGSKR